MIQRLVFDGWQPHPLNEFLYAHRHVRSKALHTDAEVIWGEVKRQGITPARGKRRVSLVIRFNPATHSGEVDPDALFKSLLDGLRKAKVLREDNRHWLELGGVTFEAAPCRGLVVVIEDVEEASG